MILLLPTGVDVARIVVSSLNQIVRPPVGTVSGRVNVRTVHHGISRDLLHVLNPRIAAMCNCFTLINVLVIPQVTRDNARSCNVRLEEFIKTGRQMTRLTQSRLVARRRARQVLKTLLQRTTVSAICLSATISLGIVETLHVGRLRQRKALPTAPCSVTQENANVSMCTSHGLVLFLVGGVDQVYSGQCSKGETRTLTRRLTRDLVKHRLKIRLVVNLNHA